MLVTGRADRIDPAFARMLIRDTGCGVVNVDCRANAGTAIHEPGEAVDLWREHFARGIPCAGMGDLQWAGRDR